VQKQKQEEIVRVRESWREQNPMWSWAKREFKRERGKWRAREQESCV